ncbi:hypothetical protein TCAL_13510 [Tigriopus californicus]|uniref:Homeobox domain-containing protein n=1 Tax=Tigriopus californicus TaxID=6832 RepID=A0A553P7P5_TIGCA|nr:homeotic protein caudal-like isoform X2 [Tigriopus californicus]TRY73697.1 hypothetical protein TCAL_13510 [Tigriopus californicus]|eukprot:TCALIF_13510-PA protein Name:"Similar to Cdx4 Homeobox protein CDX-4 (Mus musculus)" AED:0.02 eAED:0.02 QI:93/1/1/1/0.5/0.66/3/811/432
MVSYYNPSLSNMFPVHASAHGGARHPQHSPATGAPGVSPYLAYPTPPGYHAQAAAFAQNYNISDLNSNMYAPQFASAGSAFDSGSGLQVGHGPHSPSPWHSQWYQAGQSCRASTSPYSGVESWPQHPEVQNPSVTSDSVGNPPNPTSSTTDHSPLTPTSESGGTLTTNLPPPSISPAYAGPASQSSNSPSTTPTPGQTASYNSQGEIFNKGGFDLSGSAYKDDIRSIRQSSPHYGLGQCLTEANGQGLSNEVSSLSPINTSGSGRPQPARSPFEWMKKQSYQNQTEKNGRTRTKDKYRVVYSDHQRLELEKEFCYSRYITIRRKAELANNVGLSERQVKIWFQNRRAKERRALKKQDDVISKDKLDAVAAAHAAVQHSAMSAFGEHTFPHHHQHHQLLGGIGGPPGMNGSFPPHSLAPSVSSPYSVKFEANL